MNGVRNRFLLVLALLVAVVVLVAQGAVSAHTELDHSVPADGDVVADPVSEIVLVFTDPVTPVGDGFEVLTPSGDIVIPPFETDDDEAFRLVLDPPLAGGDVGVRYEITAPDGHVQTGAFSFTVSAAPPTTSPATTSPTTSPATVPDTTVPDTAAPDTTVPDTAAAATTSPPTTVDETTTDATTAPTTDPAAADDDDPDPTWVIVAGIVAVVGAAGAVLLVRRARASA